MDLEDNLVETNYGRGTCLLQHFATSNPGLPSHTLKSLI